MAKPILKRKKGTECVALVKGALADASNGLVQDASIKLQRLKEDSIHLAAEAGQMVKKLEEEEAHFMKKEEALMREMGGLGCQEEDLEREKNSEQAYLDGKKQVLRDNESKLRSAESAVEDAEERLRREEEKERNSLTTGAIVGAIFLGPIGAALGIGITALVNVINDEVKEAKDRLERYKTDCRRAESEVEDSKRRVSNLQSEMNNLERRIRELRKE